MKEVYLRHKKTGMFYHVWYKRKGKDFWYDGNLTRTDGASIVDSGRFVKLRRESFDVIHRNNFLKEIEPKPKPKVGDWVVTGNCYVGKIIGATKKEYTIAPINEPEDWFTAPESKLQTITEGEILPILLKSMKDYENSIK